MIKARHRVVLSGGPVDSDMEVHPDGEASSLWPSTWLALRALQAEFALDDWPKGFFC
jgi:hypothetical protein